ncbi:MAG: Protein fmp52, mitochondrial [Pycnora praestabilis]|nr:MAG: Protein fmp52, mitochondrial [Pycnora praestabilis]
MTSVGVVGSTGLVGAHILSTLLSLPSISKVSAIARRQPSADDTSPKLSPIVEPESFQWPSLLRTIALPPQIFFSALGTTRAQAGGVENQRKIDYDLNLGLAKAAREGGARVYVLISSSGADSSGTFAYTQMKGQLEEAVKALNFEYTVLLRPGLIVGTRGDSRPPEAAVRAIAKFMGAISGNVLKDFWAQDADVIGKAAVSAGMKCLAGQAPSRVWLVTQGDIVRLGRTEWRDEV